jgi:hypothetical protein
VIVKSPVLAVFLAVAALATPLAHGHAEARPLSTNQAGHRVFSGGVTVPAEWAGVWQNTDSTYKCPNLFQSTSVDSDTLCVGQSENSDLNAVCSGSATSTSVDFTCTATGEVFTDCQYTITSHVTGTRSNDTYFLVTTTTTAFSGTGAGCDLYPPTCTQTNIHGVRLGPAPAAYCATPAVPSSWGKLKATYR